MFAVFHLLAVGAAGAGAVSNILGDHPAVPDCGHRRGWRAGTNQSDHLFAGKSLGWAEPT